MPRGNDSRTLGVIPFATIEVTAEAIESEEDVEGETKAE